MILYRGEIIPNLEMTAFKMYTAFHICMVISYVIINIAQYSYQFRVPVLLKIPMFPFIINMKFFLI